MKKQVRIQLAILAGGFGFFAGGIINAGKEIVDVMLGAAVGWGLFFFVVFIILDRFCFDQAEKNLEKKESKLYIAGRGSEKNKGGKIDIVIKNEENFEDIYKMK